LALMWWSFIWICDGSELSELVLAWKMAQIYDLWLRSWSKCLLETIAD
jgi:hypothetical protein